MQRILKFPVTPHFTINVPSEARILAVQISRGQPQMWVLVDPEVPNVERSFRAYTTGEEIHGRIGEYVATYQTDDGGYVYHLFETT